MEKVYRLLYDCNHYLKWALTKNTKVEVGVDQGKKMVEVGKLGSSRQEERRGQIFSS